MNFNKIKLERLPDYFPHFWWALWAPIGIILGPQIFSLCLVTTSLIALLVIIYKAIRVPQTFKVLKQKYPLMTVLFQGANVAVGYSMLLYIDQGIAGARSLTQLWFIMMIVILSLIPSYNNKLSKIDYVATALAIMSAIIGASSKGLSLHLFGMALVQLLFSGSAAATLKLAQRDCEHTADIAFLRGGFQWIILFLVSSKTGLIKFDSFEIYTIQHYIIALLFGVSAFFADYQWGVSLNYRCEKWVLKISLVRNILAIIIISMISNELFDFPKYVSIVVSLSSLILYALNALNKKRRIREKKSFV